MAKPVIVRIRGLALSAVFASGAATAMAGADKPYETEHHRYVVGGHMRWKVKATRRPLPARTFTERIKTGGETMAFQMLVAENPVFDSGIRQRSARWVADDYRSREKQTMVTMGVNTGQYRLTGPVMRDTVLADKRFFVMDYSTVQGEVLQLASLFLYFPRDSANDYFVMVLYSEAGPAGKPWSPRYRSECHRVLESLSRK